VRLFHSEVLINARPSTVWNVITDGANFGVWESGLQEAAGRIGSGDKVRITPTGRRRPLSLRVHQVDGKVMTLRRRLPLGLWNRTRTYTLTGEASRTRLSITEKHRGLLLPFSRHSAADEFLQRFTAAVRNRSEVLDRVF
jgi:hypothetical protein